MSVQRNLKLAMELLLLAALLCSSSAMGQTSENEESVDVDIAAAEAVAESAEEADDAEDAEDEDAYREPEDAYREREDTYRVREEIREPARDPFAASGRLSSWENQNSFDSGFRPGMTRTGDVPKMSLRGHLKARDGETIALLEIHGGGIHIVREGDTVGLYDLGYDSVIRIRKIDKLHLVVESGSLGRTIIVR